MADIIDAKTKFVEEFKNEANTKSETRFKLLARDAGIDSYSSSILYFQEENVLDRNKYLELLHFEKKVIEKIDNKEFLNKILTRLEILRKYGNYEVIGNTLKGSLNYLRNYKTDICIKDNIITYKTNCGDNVTKGSIEQKSDNYRELKISDKVKNKVLYMDESEKNVKEEYHRIHTRDKKVLLKDNFEMIKTETEEFENFYYDTKSKMRRLVPTEEKENTIETKRYYRIDNKVLYEYMLQFKNKKPVEKPEDIDEKTVNKEEYYIADNFRPYDETIPTMLYFIRTDYENFENRIKSADEKNKVKKM